MYVAVTVASAFMVIVHVPVPEHPPPDQPAKVEQVSGCAVKVIEAPDIYSSVQSEPQFIPVAVTVPVEVPFLFTVSIYPVTFPLIAISRFGVSGSFDETVSVAIFCPKDEGVSVIEIWQVPEGETVMFEHVSVCLMNSEALAPEMLTVFIKRSAVPGFETVMACVTGATTFPKARGDGVAEMSGIRNVIAFVILLPDVS